MGRQSAKRFQAECYRRYRRYRSSDHHARPLPPLRMGIAVPQAELLHEQQGKQGDRPK